MRLKVMSFEETSNKSQNGSSYLFVWAMHLALSIILVHTSQKASNCKNDHPIEITKCIRIIRYIQLSEDSQVNP
jgi:hypothetical protein